MYYGRYLLLILEINAELIYDEAKIVIHFSDFTYTNVLSHKFKRMGIIFQHRLLVIPPTCSVANWSESFKNLACQNAERIIFSSLDFIG